MTEKKKKKKKISGIHVAVGVEVAIIFMAVIGFAVAVFMVTNIMKTAPEMNVNDFVNQQSSMIFDSNGELIAEVGSVKRENITYNDLPNCLVDAFVATEDSRFFTHPGFDISRFSKAMLENIKSMSFAQGGSTFTMQLLKNTYYTDDNKGTEAVKSIDRKVQEIFLSMDLEKMISKKAILENYLNKLNFGGSGNIRGIEKASQFYFGKSASELNITESALLAGVINAPSAYNPYNDLEAATNRRDTVLYLMNYHGYITDTEYALAKTVKVEDLLKDPSSNRGNIGDGIPFQAYIDEVIAETYELTGLDPATTSMKIYTNMNREIQTLMDEIQAGHVDGYFEFSDDKMEIASIMMNNHTGEIVGILGGRNYSYGGALLLNHATNQYNQPGSSVKGMLDYALAFEELGWSTSHVILDAPVTIDGSVEISNYNDQYYGQMTLKDAIGNSMNTPAVRALQGVIADESRAYVVDYLNKLGFEDVTTDTFNMQYAFGGSTFSVSTLTLANAQSTLFNGGVRVIPHTVARIEFDNGNPPVIPEHETVQALSEQSAFLTTELLYSNVENQYGYMYVLDDYYPVYAKTGTSDWGDAGYVYDIPYGAAKDSWMVASTSEYTTATWLGYDKYIKGEGTYLAYSDTELNIPGKVANLLLDKSVEVFGEPGYVAKPSGITSITHIIGTYPYASPVEGMDEKYITTGYINSNYANLVSPESTPIDAMKGEISIGLDGNTNTISVKWPTYPKPEKLKVASDVYEYEVEEGGKLVKKTAGKRLFDYSWIYGPIRYTAEIKVNGTPAETIVSDKEEAVGKFIIKPGDHVEVCGYYAYENRELNKNKSNESCKSITVEDSEIKLRVPKKNSSYEDIMTWASKYYIVLGEVTYEPDDNHKDGTIAILRDGVEVTGETVRLMQSEIHRSTWTLVHYVKPQIDPEPTPSPEDPQLPETDD